MSKKLIVFFKKSSVKRKIILFVSVFFALYVADTVRQNLIIKYIEKRIEKKYTKPPISSEHTGEYSNFFLKEKEAKKTKERLFGVSFFPKIIFVKYYIYNVQMVKGIRNEFVSAFGIKRGDVSYKKENLLQDKEVVKIDELVIPMLTLNFTFPDFELNKDFDEINVMSIEQGKLNFFGTYTNERGNWSIDEEGKFQNISIENGEIYDMSISRKREKEIVKIYNRRKKEKKFSDLQFENLYQTPYSRLLKKSYFYIEDKLISNTLYNEFGSKTKTTNYWMILATF